MANSIISQIEESRKELLDFGLRNPLISYRTLRARGVETIDADPATVFDILVRRNRSVSFLDADYSGASQLNTRLRTEHPPEELRRRLLNTSRIANTSIQEQGVNTLFVALGMVVWYESDSTNIERHAPLVLVPVNLERASVNARFNVRYTGEELGANMSFMEKVRMEFRVNLPGLHDDEEEDDEDIDLEAYFLKVERSINGMSRWSVDAASVVLGFFSFNKLLMYRDLDAENWPSGSGPQESEIMRSLFGEEGFSEPESGISDEDHLDEYLEPEDVHHVVDADSSQALAIHDVSNGRNLVIQGPPGTGKSQTITNIIADAISQKKRVLFVSEKMAALEVVKRRMDALGLGDACLELHSHKTNKRAVLDELKRTWVLGSPNIEGIEDDFASLKRIRDSLNEYANAVNAPLGDTGVTPFRAYGELMRIQDSLERQDNVSLPRPEIPGIDSWLGPVFDQKLSIVSNLQNVLRRVGVPKEHIFWGARLRVALPPDIPSLRDQIDSAAHALEAMLEESGALADAVHLSAPEDFAHLNRLLATAERIAEAPDIRGVNITAPEWRERRADIAVLMDSGVRWKNLRAEYESVLIPNAWEAEDIWELRRILSMNGRRFLKFINPEYRRAKKRISTLCKDALPKDVEQQIALADTIIEDQRLREAIDLMSPAATAALGRQWRGRLSDWEELSRVTAWALNLFDDIDSRKVDPGIVRSLDEGIDLNSVPALLERVRKTVGPHLKRSEDIQRSLEMDFEKRFNNQSGLTGLKLEEQRQILADWANNTIAIQDLAAFNIALTSEEMKGLDPIATLAEEWPGASELLSLCLEQKRYESIVSRAFAERPALEHFNGLTHQDNIKSFRQIDDLSLDHNRARVAYAHWEDLPAYTGAGQLGILTKEFEKKKKHLPIRQLVNRAGNAIQAIKPVFMMSPLSVATYLAPGSVKFDLVVFDEASQVKPVDAFGALIRAEQAAVVGDDRQLPPTSFFESVTHSEDEDDSATSDIESVLGLMRAKGCPSKMLRWHYRSRHESLIAVSNHEFYEDNLVVFPSPDSRKRDVGLRYHYSPDTVYNSGVNRLEAKEVAEAVMAHARSTPELTLGVAAFSVAQMQAVLDELETLRRQDDSCEAFFNAHPEEPFFVKNLENVQGDERDVIFISVGYGRQASGQVYMNFGPLNKDGGERRLNVIITRARRRCHVFTNLLAADINLGSSQSAGLRAFKTFLAYAESGELPADTPIASGRDMDSPFQRAVVSRLRSLGYEAHEEVASGGKFIDIGIVDPERPGKYIIGIECDGASYHSSRSARDRDRIRESVLRGLGWKFHRIWSTDWFLNAERELKRAVEAIELAKAAQSVEPSKEESAWSEREPTQVEPPVEKSSKSEIERTETPKDRGLSVPRYELAKPRVNIGHYGLSDIPAIYLDKPIIEVVRVEGPVHVSVVARRIANATGVKKIGAKIRANLNNAIENVLRSRSVSRKGQFLWPSGMEKPVVRDRVAIPRYDGKKIENIAPEEIAEAIKMVVERSYGIDRSDAVSEAGRLLGFKSISGNIRAKIDSVAKKLIADGRLDDSDGHLTLP